MRNNSIITKNPQEHHIFDLTRLGTVTITNDLIEVTQQNHFFQIGDVLYYNIKTQLFGKAVAVNNIESEVCGVVLDVKDKDTFVMITEGKINTSRYSFEIDTPLYLSEVYPGRLMSIEPKNVIKQIATQTVDGIIVDIQRGYRTVGSSSVLEELEPYTQSELDEIIKNIW